MKAWAALSGPVSSWPPDVSMRLACSCLNSRRKRSNALRAWAGVSWLDDTPAGWPLPQRLRVAVRSEEHTSELQSPDHLVSRLLLEKKQPAAQWEHTGPLAGQTAPLCYDRRIDPPCRLRA